MITVKTKILERYGKELEKEFDTNADTITNSSVARFRSMDNNICFRVKTLLTFTGKLQKIARKDLGSMDYDIVTQGQKIDYSTGYEYYLTEDGELTKAGLKAINKVIAYYDNKISFDFLISGKALTAGDSIINGICDYIRAINKEHATNAIKSQYKNVKAIRGGKGRRI